MMNLSECRVCSEYPRCRETWAAWIYLVIGVIATISMRLVTVLAHFNPRYGQIAWYIAICGFFVFFLKKYRADTARARLVVEHDLVAKVASGAALEPRDRAHVRALLCSISRTKDRINFFVIFFSSIVALIAAIYFDFIRQ